MKPRWLLLGVLAAGLLALYGGAAGASGRVAAAGRIRVASKPFTESYILSEMVAQLIEDAGEATAERRFGLGGPNLVVEALRSGEVDVDVNYTGSLLHLFLKERSTATLDELRAELLRQGLIVGDSLGFNNTYAIAVRHKTAEELHLRKVSDLRGHPELRGAFTADFLNFDDGFYKLQQVYGVALNSVKPMQHALAYRALQSSEIDLTDAYTTDGTLPQFDLTLLEDDRDFFPKYYGVVVARAELAQRYPRSWAALRRLDGRLDEPTMISLNAGVDNKLRSVEETARTFLRARGLLSQSEPAGPSAGSVLDAGLTVATYEHLTLVIISLLLSCLLGVPLGIIAFNYPKLGQVLVAGTGLLQTIPSLALLCFLIPLLGIGALPTIFALFIYGLLPIAQSTISGLQSLDPRLLETARILGLTRLQRLRLIELPLASISILGGIKTAAVINVATATIAALIGAGGYGGYITRGLAMNDIPTILKGATPTALMAVGFHGFFELLGRHLIPKGLRA
ncbi:MAG TPA: glycine betaine ABC transporter substrate-binding protein [Pseudomonadota bacterium]|nr:glycine betaine ABC transporter substrate-binding protein [Pseudomonadota bacterium]